MTKKLQGIAKETFGENIDESTPLQDVPSWDSMNHMRFIMAIEDQFDIVLEADDIVDIKDLSSAASILVKYGVEP